MINTLSLSDFRKVPPSTGVYLFKRDGEILYVGKAVSLKVRILSHFENAKLDPKENLIIRNSNKIEFILTDSEFKALLLESSLIQKYQPKYNARWKDNKSLLYIKITTRDEFPKVFTVRRENDCKSLYFGPFPAMRDAEKILGSVRRLYPFCRQKKIGKHACFYAKLKLCNPCPSEISKLTDKNEASRLKKIYRYNIKQLVRILRGDVDLALNQSYKLLKKLARTENFEDALRLRNHIQRFEQLISQSQFSADITTSFNRSLESLDILKKILKLYFDPLNSLHRIECYDVSNLFQKDATAAMVVFTDGMPDTSQYKRFRIKSKNIKSDFEMLEEIIYRRYRHDWPEPNLIVVDGGTPQLLKVKQVLSDLKKNIPLIGIAKHPDRLAINTRLKIITIRPRLNNLGFNLIRALRDEAHRFARKYHLFLRRKGMMI